MTRMSIFGQSARPRLDGVYDIRSISGCEVTGTDWRETLWRLREWLADDPDAVVTVTRRPGAHRRAKSWVWVAGDLDRLDPDLEPH